MLSTRLVAAALGATLTALPMTTAPAQTLGSPQNDTTSRVADSTELSDTAASGPTLALDEAISLALKNNPDYLSTRDARRAASAGTSVSVRRAGTTFTSRLFSERWRSRRERSPEQFNFVAHSQPTGPP